METVMLNGYPYKLVNGWIEVSAFWRCQKCDTYPGRVWQKEWLEGNYVVSYHECRCGARTDLSPIAVDG